MNTRCTLKEQYNNEEDDALSSLPNAVSKTKQLVMCNSIEINMTIEEYLKAKAINKKTYMEITSTKEYANRTVVYEFATKISVDTKSVKSIMRLFGYSLRLNEIEHLKVV